MGNPYDAPILTDIITVDINGTTINLDVVKYQHVEFVFDNQGTKNLVIEGIGEASIKLVPNSQIIITQERVSSITLKASIDTTTVFYSIFGYRRLNV